MRVSILAICVLTISFAFLALSEWQENKEVLEKVLDMEIFDAYDVQSDEGDLTAWGKENNLDILEAIMEAAKWDSNGDDSTEVKHQSLVRHAHTINIKPNDVLFDDDMASAPKKKPIDPIFGNTYDDYLDSVGFGCDNQFKKDLEKIYQKICEANEAKTEMDTSVRFAFLIGAVFSAIMMSIIALMIQFCRHHKETGHYCPDAATSSVSRRTSGSMAVSASSNEVREIHSV